MFEKSRQIYLRHKMEKKKKHTHGNFFYFVWHISFGHIKLVWCCHYLLTCERSCICVRGVDVDTVSMIFLFKLGTVLPVWYF